MKKPLIAYSAASMLVATRSFNALAEDPAFNCDTAQENIAKLQAEKKSSLE